MEKPQTKCGEGKKLELKHSSNKLICTMSSSTPNMQRLTDFMRKDKRKLMILPLSKLPQRWKPLLSKPELILTQQPRLLQI